MKRRGDSPHIGDATSMSKVIESAEENHTEANNVG